MTVQFEEQQNSTFTGGVNAYQDSQSSAMSRFLIKHNICKSFRGAQNFMLVFVIVCMALSAYIIYRTFYYTPTIVNANPQAVLIQQKTEEYVRQGMDPAEAQQRAVQEVVGVPAEGATK